MSGSRTSITSVGVRTTEVKNLKILKSPEEGGTKKEFEDFIEKISNHVAISWKRGKDISYLLTKMEEPQFEIPKDLSEEEKKSSFKLAMWNKDVDKYSERVDIFQDNKAAIFALIVGAVSKMTRSKLKSKENFSLKELNEDVLWLLESLDDIMVNFEKVKPNELAIDDQMERIMNLKQSESAKNDDFINLVQKEVKVLEKHGGKFLWGTHHEEESKQKLDKIKDEHKIKSKSEMDEVELKEHTERINKEIKNRIIAMAIIKRSCSKRYQTLKLKLQNDFLLGGNNYPTSIPGALKLLNNFKCESPMSSSENTQESRGRNNRNNSVLPGDESQVQVNYLRGTNRAFHPTVTCRRCNIRGHYQQFCPVATNERGTMIPTRSSTSTTSTAQTDEGEEVPPNNQEGTSSQDNGPSTAVSTEEVSHRSGIGLGQNHLDAHINPNWILLDSESSEHIFKNGSLLENIEPTTDGETLRLFSNGGFIDTNQKGKFGNFSVWYNPRSLANILSLALVTEQYRVTLDTGVDNAFVVHVSEKHTIRFKRDKSGLYFFDTTKIDLANLMEAFSFLNTVTDNKDMYGKRDIRKADEAKILNRKLNHVAKDKYVRLIKDNWIRNVPFTVGDVRRSHQIYGPPVPSIKGRTKYKKGKRIPDPSDIIQIPKQMYANMKNVTLCIDFFFVNGVTVFHSISRKLGYRTVSFPTNRTAGSILSELQDIYRIYNARGFKIIEIHADNEFKKIEKNILPIRLRTVGVDEHVPEVERSIQTLKNESRSVCHAMPYKCIPRIMIRELVKQGNEFLNAFGNEDSLATGLSPRNILDNLPHVDYNDLKYEFGQYVQLHVTQKFTNNMKSRTIGAIVLGPNNIRGTYTYMSLETGEKKDGRVVAALPITDDVIHRVEQLGLKQGQPYRNSKMLQFEWRPGLAFSEDDAILNTASLPHQQLIIPPPINQNKDHQRITMVYDEESSSHQGANIDMDDDSRWSNRADENRLDEDEGAQIDENEGAQIGENEGAQSGSDSEDEASNAESDEASNVQSEFDQEETDTIIDVIYNNNEAIDEGITTEGNHVGLENELMEEENTQPSDDESIEDDDSIEDRRRNEKERRQQHLMEHSGDSYGRGKRKKKPNQAYSFLQTEFKNLDDIERETFFSHAWNEYKISGRTNMLERYTTGLVFAQMSAHKGIKKYKQEAELMLIAEFKQLLEYKTFHGVKESDLTSEQKLKAGNMINLIEEKINRGHTPENPVLKGRSCFNGRVQRGLYTKEQTASPTVSQDAFFLTSIIDALEGRKKAITDVKGAYLNAKMKDVVIMKIIGPEVDLFCKLDSTLKEYVTKEKGRKVLYTQLDKALYGCVQSALLWYELYSSTLLEMGFVINPYDLCVANANLEGHQCTICWYVDDNKISHKDPKVIERVIKRIEEKFGTMSKTMEEEHDFLGMHIKYKNKKVEVTMKKHILKAINDFMDDITRNAATPAKTYLFQVRESADLNEEKAENFHSVVALLLFISRRCRLDIQTAVAFLTTRVAQPTEDDWAKLKRVLQYLRGTIDLKLTLGADDIMKSKTWVDVSYGVHNDCKSHTGGAMSWGWGVLMTKCQKQKLNTKSSTEGEIVGLSDYLPNVIWARMFLDEQGYSLQENIVYQDNMSAMKIANNGKRSSGQRTKHMDNRYFWIKDRVKSERITIQYCPTEQMVADFFTKPLQGSSFKKMRDIILGYKHISTLNEVEGTTIPEERVE